MSVEVNTKESVKTSIDVESIRRDFPILESKIKGNPLIYLDNAATTQKPKVVIERMNEYYFAQNSNVHRGVHTLSEIATNAYEDAREKIKTLINAADSKEIIFTRGTTESINLVANSYGRMVVKEGDEIIISIMEHHSNIVPWQILAEEKKAKLRIIPINDNGELLIDEFEKLLNEKTKFVSVVHISNSLGTINPIKKIIDISHNHGVPILIDGAQGIMHTAVDVQELDCDFYVFSGHKLYGPTGIGVLYGKSNLLNTMPPYQGGGDMIRSVTFEKTTYNDIPNKFEAGTPNIAGAVGLGTAIGYILKIGINNIAEYENELLKYATDVLSSIKELKIIGTAKEKASIISFVLENIHPHDIGTVLDYEGIAIRTGHHCTQPLMHRFNVPATARASLAFYNTKSEIDAISEGIKKVIKVFN